jgi:hypothetical protein
MTKSKAERRRDLGRASTTSAARRAADLAPAGKAKPRSACCRAMVDQGPASPPSFFCQQLAAGSYSASRSTALTSLRK